MAEGGGEEQQQANQAPGYSYEFIDKVPEDYYCYKCKLVAKDLTFTSCCGETFCLECIEKYIQEGEPCPGCGVEGVMALKQVKYQHRIRKLSVACELKERGCEWKGTVEEMEAHLDPALDNCQYVDIQCPLNCQQKIPKNKMEEHLKDLCVKRDFFCQHCNYKASYEEVINVHLLVCRFVPVQCPNRCGVTCEREDLEDHLETCRLQDIECEFANIGCNAKFCREDMTQHMDDNSFRHLMLVASHSRKSKEEFEEKIEEQRKEREEEKKILTKRLEDEEKEVEDLRGDLSNLQEKYKILLNQLNGTDEGLVQQQAKLEDHKKEMKVELKGHEEKVEKMKVELEGHEEKMTVKLKGHEEEVTVKFKGHEEKVEKMKVELKGHQEKMTVKLKGHEEKMEKMKVELEGYDQNMEKIKGYEEKMEKMKVELQGRKKEIDKLNANLKDQQKDFKEKIVKQQLQISDQKSSLQDEFDQKMEAANTKCNLLEAEMKEGERRLATLTERLEELDERCKQLQADKDESAENARKLEQKVRSLTDQRDKLSEEVKRLSDKTEKNEKQTTLQQEGIKKLQSKKADNSLEEIKRLKELIDRHVERFVRLEEKLPKVNAMSDYLGNFERTFEMKNFTMEKDKNKARDWKSPAMYTHMCGYKFCIGLDANGRGGSQGEAIYAELYVMPGEYDSLLRWPAKASFTLELIHQRGGKNVKYNTAMKKWDKPELNFKCLSVFPYTEVNNSYCFLEHNKLGDFLVDDTLKFCTSVVLH